MAKTKDLFLNIAANPNMTLEDLASVGLTSENTMLLDRAQYASNEKVQDMFRDAEGNFDEQKFNAFYDIAEQSYNILANDEVNLDLVNVTAYDVDNIFVDPSKRKQENKPFAIKLPNPDRLNVGVTRIGKIGPRTLSQDEIAQTQKVILNPTAVANGEAPIYGSAPNESWFEDFWDTRVMAAWDEDGTHIDPVTGQEVQHKAGDLKLNENGTYYYESLDGRSVYGKRILNKFNTLTTDGSAWNKYDFFDSDDIEQKSIGGSIAKNLALVGTMFIPYVGWGVALASVAHQSAGLFATLGKMLAGSDSPTLDAIEGWVKSTDRRNLKTEYAQQNTWCWENFIDLIGDTTAQLREQRAIFKFVPGLIKGNFKALSKEAMDKEMEKIVKESMDNFTNKSFGDLAKIAYRKDPGNWEKQLSLLSNEARGVFTAKAEKAVRDYVQSYYKLGEPIAKAYMTAITVQDTFGEAIQAGATDSEATLLTLGYAAAEAALLSTDLGKWIMPELRTEKLRHKMIAKKLLELPQETRDLSRQLSRLDGATKKAWAKRLFNVGRDIMNAEYSMMPTTLGTIAAQGLGEGVEEVSEELLADFSKSCFNLVQQLQGDDTRMQAWENMGDRYGMSFVGGIMGGGINAAASDYNDNREIMSMDSKQAMQQLIYMARNNELDDFWKAINKTKLASTELSTKLNEDGIGYKQGTKEDNQDLAAKKALRKQIDLINSILNAENAKLDDNGLLSAMIKSDPSLKDLDPVKDFRMRALANSATAGRFLNEWNTILTDIVKLSSEISQTTSKLKDSTTDEERKQIQQELKPKQEALKKLQQQKEEMLDGSRTREYVRDALFEMSYGINEVFNKHVTEVVYAEAKTGKKYKDLSEDQKRELHESYQTFKDSNQYAEKVHELADIYEALSIAAGDGIQRSADFYEQIKQQNYQNITTLDKIVSSRLDHIKKLLSDKENGVINLQQYLSTAGQEALEDFDQSSVNSALDPIGTDARNRINAIINGRDESELSDLEKNKIREIEIQFGYDYSKILFNTVYDKVVNLHADFHKVGFIHPEVKLALRGMTETLSKFASELQEYYDPEMPGNESDKSWDLSDYYGDFWPKLDELNANMDKLSNTPIVENLRQFQTSTSIDKTVLDLIEMLQKGEIDNIKDLSAIEFDQNTLQLFKDARDLLTMYRSAIVGARFDNVDLDNIVGFNTTLNEISGKNETPKLAEIDAQTADLILEDINKLLKRIDYSEEIHKLNSGNKYNSQDKTALNKQFILFNKIKSFVSILEKDDDEELKQSQSFIELKELVNSKSTTLLANSGFGGKYENRNFTLSLDDKTKIERESIAVQQKLHQFLTSIIDTSSEDAKEKSVKKLAKMFTYERFKGLIRENNDFLHRTSEDIDDSAFIWWMCATAALSPDQFFNTYRTILGTESEGEKPIAPIPTQELGVFALTAAIVNHDMFKVFGKALRTSLSEYWETRNETERAQIQNDAEASYICSDSKKQYFLNNDFLPNFDNIVFVEGIAGSGKTVGVLRTLGKLLAKSNPEFMDQKVFFAHTSQSKATKLGNSTLFTNFEAHDHDSLLSYMSADYNPKQLEDGVYKYVLDKDVVLVNGILRGKWNVRSYNEAEVPKLFIIDEWSHYNQLEQDLIQRFCQKYGSIVMSMGDYDQLTPISRILDENGKEILEINPNRNTTPRVAKLGVSMRTDNNVKNGNMERLLAWAKSPTKTPIQLHHYEDQTGIYGDKLYQVGQSYGNQLQAIQNDVKRMISTLRALESGESNKIGYIYSDPNSELYKWLTTTEGIKEHINPLSDKDAHGEEAQYYIVENDRSADQDALQYFRSVNTGVTRSEQGSILIAGTDYVSHTTNKAGQLLDNISKYNQAGIKFASVVDTEMLPDTYTAAGTKEFTKRRKNILDSIYGTSEVTPFEIKERSKQNVPLDQVNPKQSTSSQEKQQTQQEPASKPAEEFTPTSEISPERQEERKPEEWKSEFKKYQMVYFSQGGFPYARVIGEDFSDPNNPKYKIIELSDTTEKLVDQSWLHSHYIKLPTEAKLFEKGDKFMYQGTKYTVEDFKLEGPSDNPTWVYVANNTAFSHKIAKEALDLGTFLKVTDEVTPDKKVETTEYDLGSRQEQEEALSEAFKDEYPSAVSQNVNNQDIDFSLFGFSFNTQYFADKFDENDNIVTQSNDRIDCGYGLNKMNESLFTNKKQIKEAIGQIRKHLQFKSNADICAYVTHITGVQELNIKWGFISKTDDNKNSKYDRYNAPQAGIQYSQKENKVSKKMLSAVFFDKSGQAVLEMPILTLQSPHSIFKDMKRQGIGTDVTQIWDTKTAKSDTYLILNNIINHIRTDRANMPGYQALADVIQLWLFTSNGIKFLPNNWNLSANAVNLGNKFIVDRESDDVPEFNYEGTWEELPKLERSDRFTSSILMNDSDYYDANGITYEAIKAYTPYILTSDSPNITTDEQAVYQYLKQLTGESKEMLVKVVPVSEPEVSVSTYLKEIHKRQTQDPSERKPNIFGNRYSPYRIWSAILKSPNSELKNKILQKLEVSDRNEVIKLVQELNQRESQINPSDYRSKLEYQINVAAVLNQYDATTTAFYTLRRHLLRTCMYSPFGTDQVGNQEILEAIDSICIAKDSGITGIKCKAQFSEDKSKKIAKFARKVAVEGKYKFPGQGYFRSFGKVDPPTYNLTSMLGDIKTWAADAEYGYDLIDYKTGKVIRHVDAWRFKDKSDEDLYLYKSEGSPINLEYILAQSNQLIGDLNIPEYNIDISELIAAPSEAHAQARALSQIHNAFNEIPGAFIIQINGTYKYGNIDPQQTSQWKGYKFKQAEYLNGKYILTFENTEGSKQIELDLDLANNSFILPEPPKTASSTISNVEELINVFNSTKNSPIFKGITSVSTICDDIITYLHTSDSADIETIKNMIQESSLDELSKTALIVDLEGDQNQQLDCVIPTKIKFLK